MSRAAAGYPWLVADIGGSNARFGWIAGPGQGVQHVRKLAVADHATLEAAVRTYMAGLGADGTAGPRRAALAVATAVAGDRVELTNSHWSFSRQQLQAALGLEALLLLNDFEALALSLPRLGSQQLRAHGELPQPVGCLAVIGPGTGLGVAGVVQTRQGWVALPGEGGHATLAPANDFESELLALVRRDHAHVSAERLLSGIGLPTLHSAVSTLLGEGPVQRTAEQIVEAALSGSDAVSVRSMEQFCAFLGGFAGNVALTLGARGGVYIGGGIVPRLGELFFRSEFRARFEAKGRFQSYLHQIPTALITDTLVALEGASQALIQLSVE